MANHLKHLIYHMNPSVQQAQNGESPSKTAASLLERGTAVGSPLLSFLANLHPIMAMLMKVMLLTAAAGTMRATQDAPWLRRSLLLLALLTASFTLFHLLSRKYTGRMLLFRSLSVLFTAGMIIWSLATFGF